VSIKIEGNLRQGTDVRRVRVEDLPRESKSDFQTVTTYVKTSFPATPNFILKYKDEEGDLVTVSCETEFQEALRVASLSKRCLKLHLIEVSQPQPKPKQLTVPKDDPLIVDPLTIEFQFGGRTQTVIVSKSSVSLNLLLEKAVATFPELKSKDFNLKYLDDEGDAVTMTEADELQDALQLVKDGQPFVLVLSLNVSSVPTSLVSSPEPNGSKPEKVQKEEERKKKKQWEDITWDDLNETLEKLQRLGFTDTALCTRLLEHHNYEYDAVLRDLQARQQSEK